MRDLAQKKDPRLAGGRFETSGGGPEEFSSAHAVRLVPHSDPSTHRDRVVSAKEPPWHLGFKVQCVECYVCSPLVLGWGCITCCQNFACALQPVVFLRHDPSESPA